MCHINTIVNANKVSCDYVNTLKNLDTICWINSDEKSTN